MHKLVAAQLLIGWWLYLVASDWLQENYQIQKLMDQDRQRRAAGWAGYAYAWCAEYHYHSLSVSAEPSCMIGYYYDYYYYLCICMMCWISLSQAECVCWAKLYDWLLLWLLLLSMHMHDVLNIFITGWVCLLSQAVWLQYKASCCVKALLSLWGTISKLLLLLNPFNGLFSGTSCVSQYQKGKTSLDLNEARDDGVLYW